jgi:hypothetical protein
MMWAQIIKVSPQYGALVVYDSSAGYTVTVTALDEKGDFTSRKYYADTKEYEIQGRKKYAAIFPALPPGNYYVSGWGKRVTVFPNMIAEVSP